MTLKIISEINEICYYTNIITIHKSYNWAITKNEDNINFVRIYKDDNNNLKLNKSFKIYPDEIYFDLQKYKYFINEDDIFDIIIIYLKYGDNEKTICLNRNCEAYLLNDDNGKTIDKII